ncbi:membrane protein [Terrihabitans soli]|uniref:Membrane protein n=1 Tax=Terrihabitans soli TaxID=708113 RepID=A0A6S6QPG2_9HYPH|nr:NfeD family protein [Terrihabitans soli]BCJ89817.1 membrane protein [Terrihabitans soli]
MILDLIKTLGVWNWFVLGLILLGIELLVPGTFMLWLGIAALLTGAVTLIIGIGWQVQLIAFAILSVLAVIGWWVYPSRAKKDGSEPVLHRRADLHIGRVFTLEEPIVGGLGRVHIDDSIWRISGDDLPAGSKVRVASTDGALLKVVPA